VNFDILYQLMIRYSILARCFRTNWNAMRQYIIYKKGCDFARVKNLCIIQIKLGLLKLVMMCVHETLVMSRQVNLHKMCSSFV